MKTIENRTDKKRSAFLRIWTLAVIISVLACSLKLTADAGSSKMIITAIDLGEKNTGDATMITDQNGKALLVDSGDNHNRSIFSWLDRNGYKKKKFDTLVTHWHDDHAGNTAEIIRKYKVGTVYIPPLDYVNKHNTSYYKYERTYVSKTLAAAKARGTKVVYLRKGKTFNVGSISAKVLYICGSPESESSYDIMYYNNNSAAIMFKGGGAKLLMSGDLMKAGEKRLVNSGEDIKADIFQLNHHGYDGSNNQFFLDKVDPAFAWFSNYNSTPSKYSVGSISASVSRIGKKSNTFSTRYNGNIKFTCSEGTITANANRNTVKMYEKLTNIKTGKSVKKAYVFNKACGVHLDKTLFDTSKYYNQQLDAKGAIFSGNSVKIGKYYYLQSGSMKAYHTLAKCKGKWYLYGSKGARLSGMRKFNGKQYYFTPERATGFKKIGGAKYYFIDKKYKYYKEANEGAMATGFRIINNKMYYFAEPKLSTYKAEDRGKMQMGFKRIDGGLYYFAAKSMEGYTSAQAGVLQHGWRTISGSRYFLKSNGKAAIGWFTVGGNTYYFDQNGKLVTGVLKLEDKIYHLDKDGRLVHGWHKIIRNNDDNSVIDMLQRSDCLDENGEETAAWTDVEADISYADENGVVLTGEQTIDGILYRFDEEGILIPEEAPAGTGATDDLPDNEIAPEVEPADGIEPGNGTDPGDGTVSGEGTVTEDGTGTGEGTSTDGEKTDSGENSSEGSSTGESVTTGGDNTDPVDPPADPVDPPEDPDSVGGDHGGNADPSSGTENDPDGSGSGQAAEPAGDAG